MGILLGCGNCHTLFLWNKGADQKKKEVAPVANYNTFCLVDTKTQKILLITSGARKCKKAFIKGHRVEVWNGNELKKRIYHRNIEELHEYIEREKRYIAAKQKRAEERNKRRKNKLKGRGTMPC